MNQNHGCADVAAWRWYHCSVSVGADPGDVAHRPFCSGMFCRTCPLFRSSNHREHLPDMFSTLLSETPGGYKIFQLCHRLGLDITPGGYTTFQLCHRLGLGTTPGWYRIFGTGSPIDLLQMLIFLCRLKHTHGNKKKNKI